MPSTVVVQLAALVSLSVQNAIYTLCRRFAFGVLRQHWSSASVLFTGELVKLLWAGSVVVSPHRSGEAYDGRAGLDRIVFLVQRSELMLVPAVIFFAMNLLSFVSLKRIDAATFTILAQGKIASTALCSVAMLGRRLSAHQWRALALLSIGQVLMNSEAFGHSSNGQAADRGEYVLGVAACLLEVTLSGFCSVYFERILKQHPQDIWDRNIQLAVHSMWLYAPLLLLNRGFAGWTWMAFAVSVLGALGGILVAVSVKVTSSIHKTFATGGAIVQTCLFGWLLLDGPMSIITVCGAACALLAIFNFTDPTSKPPAPPSSAVTPAPASAPASASAPALTPASAETFPERHHHSHQIRRTSPLRGGGGGTAEHTAPLLSGKDAR